MQAERGKLRENPVNRLYLKMQRDVLATLVKERNLEGYEDWSLVGLSRCRRCCLDSRDGQRLL